jgi:pimeloyl-ACP methyl ester carboxylesterase
MQTGSRTAATPNRNEEYMRNILLNIIILILWQTPVAASDVQKEKRWSEQISDSLLSGEVCELKAAETPFMGIYTEPEEGPTGRAVILVHGIGAHPDWPEVIHPLRVGLPEHGWATLSIQMPILANDAELKDYLPLFDESGPRLKAAVDYLHQHGAKTVVIVSHSLGASMAARFVADNPRAVDGLVIIGMSVIELDEKMNGARALEKITLPVFDLYGSRDLDGVLKSTDARARAAHKAGNPDYRQFAIEGGDHFYVGTEDELLSRVYGWLKSHYETSGGS